jgi:hypothetical protein
LGAYGLGVWEIGENTGRVQLLANYEEETFHLATPEQVQMAQPMAPPENHPVWTVFSKVANIVCWVIWKPCRVKLSLAKRPN